MNLVYLFLRKSGYPIRQMQTDGHYPLMERLVSEGVVDNVRVVMETGQDSHMSTAPGVEVITVRGGIDQFELDPGEVVWVRGGWKSWLPWIEKQKPNNWFIYYGANTGHERWPHWDVVLDDEAEEKRITDDGRLWYPYIKPIHPLFRATNEDGRTYDLCIGASHIFDRKGQFHGFEMMQHYYKMYGVKLRCIMPGGFYSHEKNTEAMKKELPKWPNVVMPKVLPREKLKDIYKASRIFVHLTCCGQGDRGPMEAGNCGCHVVLGDGRHHAPYFQHSPLASWTAGSTTDYENICRWIHNVPLEGKHERIANYFFSYQGRVLPNLVPLFQFFKENPKPNRAALKELI